MTPGKSETLKIELSDTQGGTRLLKLVGPFTIRTLFELQQIARQQTAKRIGIDVSEVPYMDSAGLGSLITVFASCQRDRREFGVIGATERIETLFQVSGVAGVIPTFPTIEAMESAAKRSQ